MAPRKRVLVLIQGSIGADRAGPEIRGWEMARALAESHDVTAAASVPAPTVHEGVPIVPRTRRSIAAAIRDKDVVIGPLIPPYALAAGAGRRVQVADLYDPVGLELGTLSGRRARREVAVQSALRRLQLETADLLLCANGRQREGIEAELAKLRRPVAPDVLTVPMGLPPRPAPASGHPLRERFAAIGPDDPVVLWWGSVWRWLDAHTVVEAIAVLAERRPDLRLVITAGRPANAATDPLNVTEEVRDLARRRGLLDRHVFFLDEWVPFAERDRYLADADLGITLHADTPEAPLAARARYMDFVWASLPTVLAAGDEIADRLEAAGAATLVAPGDVAATAAAIDALLADPARLRAAGGACAAVATEFQWPNLLAPLSARLGTAAPLPSASGQRLLTLGRTGRFYGRRALDRLHPAS
jgi:glycosyltransferase involved in cell wall biosynthesis